MKDVEEKLCCPIQGAIWVEKSIADAAREAAASGTAPKKRPRVPDLGQPEKPAKVPKAKAKGRSKAKAKAKPKAKAASGSLADGEAETLQEDIVMEEPGGDYDDSSATRPRLWLDDLIGCLSRCLPAGLLQTVDASLGGDSKDVRDASEVFSQGLMHGLEFALTGKLVLNRKTYQVWSKARPALQSHVRRLLAAKSMQRGVTEGMNMEEVLQKLSRQSQSQDVSPKSSSTEEYTSADAMARAVLGSKESLTIAQDFLRKNNKAQICNHPSFLKVLSQFKSAFCVCNADKNAWDAAAASQACHFHHDVHALPDFVGGFCQMLDNENAVPMEASLVGTASIVLAAQSAVQGRAPVAAPASQELSASPKHQGKSPRRAKSKDKDRLLASFIDSSFTSLQPYILLVSD